MDTIITITFIRKPSIWKLLSSAGQVSDEQNNGDNSLHFFPHEICSSLFDLSLSILFGIITSGVDHE